MQKWAKIENGIAKELNPTSTFTLNGEKLSGGILLLYDSIELINLGLRPINEPPQDVEHEILGTFTVDENNEVYRDYRLKDSIDDKKTKLIQAVNIERDAFLSKPFVFKDHFIQATEKDRENITLAAQRALIAKLNGKQAGDYYWYDETAPFKWITASNISILLDCEEVIEMFNTMVTTRSRVIQNARNFKDNILAAKSIEELQLYDTIDLNKNI